MNKFTLVLIIIQLIFLGIIKSSDACKIPVYRFALERWAPDLFEVIIFYDEEIPLELIDRLESGDAVRSGKSNYIVQDVSIHDMDSNTSLLWESSGADQTPLVMVRNRNAPLSEVVWYGGVDDPTVTNLADSPAREKIVESLGSGESAALVLLTCGDEAKDQAARELIQKEIKRMESQLVLPEQDPGVQADVLKLKFSYTEVSRDDPKEVFFVTQLLQTEPDLYSYSDEPLLFPVFGRGRVLYALIGDGINAENIQVACEFVIGACSCQVKELNPGMDLLATADWDSFIQHSVVGEWEMSLAMDPGAHAGSSTTIEGATAVVTATETHTKQSRSVWVSVMTALGVLLIINVGYFACRFRAMAK